MTSSGPIAKAYRRGVPRPPNTRKMTDRSVRQAETRYRKSESLKAVASRFGVDPRTLAREFSKAEIPTGSVRNFV
jgi:AraC-like DNA-binding protein